MEPFTLTLIAELVGTAVFAASGASAAVAKRLDMFGVVVIGAITALGGGAMRDVLIDAPPLVLADWRYSAVAVLAAVIVFFYHPAFSRLRIAMLLLDAAGLALFTVVGTAKGLDYDLAIYAACIVGVLSGVGGGILRDVLTQEIPVILRADFYALAAVIGSVIVAVGAPLESRIGSLALSLTAATVIFVVRLIAIKYRWQAPKPKF